MLASQEAMTKKMGDITLKGEKEALYTNESQSNNKLHGYKNGDKDKSHQGITQLRRVKKNYNKSFQENLKTFASIVGRRIYV